MRKVLWMMGYRVESENTRSLKPKQRDWLRSQRVAIWYALRYKHRCVPIQRSLWLIRSKQARLELENAKDQWLAAYKQNDYAARIEIFPVQTNEAGYKTFKQWEFDGLISWLQDIQRLNRNPRKGETKKKNEQATAKKIEMLTAILNEDFGEAYPDWNKAQKLLDSTKSLTVKA